MMKNFCLVLACVLMIVMISLPAMAADDDPYSGDSYTDIWVEGLPSPSPEVTEEPEVSSPPEVENSVEIEEETDFFEPDDEIDPVEDEVVTETEEPTVDETESDAGEVLDDDFGDGDTSGVSDDYGSEETPVIEVGTYATVRDTMTHSSDYTSPLMDAMFAVFGEYTPRTYTVTTYLDDGTEVQSTEIVPGLAGLDYNWLAGVAIFAMVLFCIFRLIGGLFRWN